MRDPGCGRLLARLDDARLESLMRIFPTKLEYAGFAATAAALALGALSGAAPDPFCAACFAYFSAACLLGGSLAREGARRGYSVEVGLVENGVTRGEGGGDGPA